MPSKTRVFFLNALSLTITSLLIRAVSVIFNIYVSNTVGSEAMGLFSLIGSVYAFSVTIAMAGINLGTTRLISDALGLGDFVLIKKSMRSALLFCTITGAVASVLLFTFANIISVHLLGDIRAVRSLKILSLTLVPVALSSCLSGYFTAVRRVKLSSFIGILIQLAKIGFTVYLLSFLVKKETEGACIGLVLGGALAELISLLINYILYLIDMRKMELKNDSECKAQSKDITKKLLNITLPVTFSACIRSLLNMLQHTLVPKGIRASGKNWSEALSSYGSLHSMALPLILFPSAFISAFSGLLIPEVSECIIQKNFERLKRTSYRSLSLSLFFSIGIAGIMLFYSQELGLYIYKSRETALYIKILAPLIPVMYIDGATDAILKGSGHQVYSMNVNIIDAFTSCIFAITLIPRLGILGYIISIYATEILNTTLSLYKMFSISKMRPKIIHQVVMPIICIIGATNFSKLILKFLPFSFSDGWSLIINMLITLFIYILLLIVTNTLGNEEKEFIFASLLSESKYREKFKATKKL